jgi:four helix bundle protein
VDVTAETRAAVQQLMVWRDADDLAGQVRDLTESFPAEERDWLTDPLCHAARSAVDRIARGWQERRHPDALIDHLTAAEADLHELQTWALLAVRHHHWSDDVADGVDRRCEAILDALSDMIHYAARWATPTVARLAA